MATTASLPGPLKLVGPRILVENGRHDGFEPIFPFGPLEHPEPEIKGTRLSGNLEQLRSKKGRLRMAENGLAGENDPRQRGRQRDSVHLTALPTHASDFPCVASHVRSPRVNVAKTGVRLTPLPRPRNAGCDGREESALHMTDSTDELPHRWAIHGLRGTHVEHGRNDTGDLEDTEMGASEGTLLRPQRLMMSR